MKEEEEEEKKEEEEEEEENSLPRSETGSTSRPKMWSLPVRLLPGPSFSYNRIEQTMTIVPLSRQLNLLVS